MTKNTLKNGTVADIQESLLHAGHVAGIMLDGDSAVRIITERAMFYITRPDPKYPFLSGDYYDVDHQNFLIMKKSLCRIQRLVKVYCASAFWLCYEQNQVIPVVLNNEMQRYYQFGKATPFDMVPEMKECCSKDSVVKAPDDENYITVLAPVKNSLQDIIGLVELTVWNPDSENAPPAWS